MEPSIETHRPEIGIEKTGTMEGSTKPRKTIIRRSRACHNCHHRKVKCVVEPQASNCNNCILDGIQCHYPESKRRGKPRQQPPPRSSEQRSVDDQGSQIHGRGNLVAKHTSRWLAESHHEQKSVGHDSSHSVRRNQPGSLGSNSPPSKTPTRYLSPSAEDTLHQELSYASLIQRHGFLLPEKSHSGGCSSPPLSPPSTVRSATHCAECNCEIRTPEIPAFVSPLAPGLDGQDICYLSRKGALGIPDLPLRSSLVRGYIENLHPWMPFLDIDLVYGSLQEKPSPRNPKISLLLFQALMFAGCASCDLTELRRGGFSSRREARKTYFERVRLLYDFDAEKDRLVVLQAVLLMTLYSENADDEKGCWHWFGVAMTIALGLGLHRSAMTSSISAKALRQRRRLWWSCYIRDRMFVQAMSRPSRIRAEEFDTPMLTCEDFEFIVNSSGLSYEEFQNVPVGDAGNQQQLAEFCVKLVELSVRVGEVIAIHFSMIPSTPQIKSMSSDYLTSTPMLYLRSNLRHEAVWRLDQELQNWFLSLPWSSVHKRSELHTSDSPSVILCRGYLHVAFYSLVSALHRPQCSATPSNSAFSDTHIQGQLLSRERVRSAANEVTSTTRELNSIGLLARGPPAFVMFQLSAILSHVQQLGSEDNQDRIKIIQQLFHTVQAVDALQQVYDGADVPATLIAHLFSKAQIHVLKDKNKEMAGIRVRGKLYLLNEISAAISTPLQQDALDEGLQRSDAQKSPQFHEYGNQSGAMMPNLGSNESDLSDFDAMSCRLSPFLTDCGNTGDDDLCFTEDFAPSFDHHMDFDSFWAYVGNESTVM